MIPSPHFCMNTHPSCPSLFPNGGILLPIRPQHGFGLSPSLASVFFPRGTQSARTPRVLRPPPRASLPLFFLPPLPQRGRSPKPSLPFFGDLFFVSPLFFSITPLVESYLGHSKTYGASTSTPFWPLTLSCYGVYAAPLFPLCFPTVPRFPSKSEGCPQLPRCCSFLHH